MEAFEYLRKRTFEGGMIHGRTTIPSYSECFSALTTGEFSHPWNDSTDSFKLGVRALREVGITHPNEEVPDDLVRNHLL